MDMLKVCGWVGCLVFLGCGSTEMIATGPAQAPRAANCDFEILTAAPLLGYREIGTVDVTPGGYGVNVFTDLKSFKDHIRENVCALGGDAALASANGYGMYIKATVLKRVANQLSARSADATPATRARHSGCEYDTQCKGARICVEGKCVAEATQAAPVADAPLAAPATNAAPSSSEPPAPAKGNASPAAAKANGSAPPAPPPAAAFKPIPAAVH